MRKRYLFLLACCLTATVLQAQQLPNASFESWTNASGAKDRPTDWNQLNSTLPSPLDLFVGQTCFKTTPGYNSATCVKLVTATAPAPQNEANGILTTGTIDYVAMTVTGGLAYPYRPDSLVGYYQCNPATGDNGTVEMTLLATNGDTVGRALFSTPGTAVSTWTRFSAPFIYSLSQVPDLGVALASSSNGYNAVLNSELWVDELSIVINPQSVNENNEKTISVLYHNNGILIDLSSAKGNISQFSLFDLQGKEILSKSISNGSVQFISAELSTGVYYYRWSNQDKSQSGKLAISNH
ncbi:MAG: T9SS type A sorting domain-containing protein [Flavobacteriales bacterium]|nr:T9SS type A sorting domain-containing protein [Flavobacteriales bacterium]